MPSAKTNCFVNTNVLIYTLDPNDPRKRALAGDLVARTIKNGTLILSPQSLNECYRVVTDRRRMMSRDDARRFVGALAAFCIAPFGFDVTRQAWQIQDTTNFSWWDSLLLASAALAGADYFFSEDLQHERRLDRMMILNPFRLSPNQLPF